MASVMAIVSKAVFEKMSPRNAKVGDVLDTDRYVSTNAAFDKLAEGDAIFLVTVRPPDERLWLVGILASPKRTDDAWVSAANATPIRDVTDAIPKLKFASGAGLQAKKGALGMSLQTPRVLDPEDVVILRGRETASDAYRAAVDAVPAATRARAEARAAAESDASLRFENYRRPFAMLDRLPEAQRKQLRQLAKQNRAGPITKLVGDPDWNAMELVDVVDVASGKVTHQMYVWSYGAGEIFENDTTTSSARIIQHSYQIAGSDLPFRKALAAAYANASPQLSEVIEFRLDEDPPPPKGSEKDLIEAMKQLAKMLPHYPNGAVLFEALSDEGRALVLKAIRSTESGCIRGADWLGLPTGDATQRWAGLAPPTVLETRVGDWPVWKWLNATAHQEIELDTLIRAAGGALSKDQIAEVCRAVAAHDGYALFASGHKYARGETNANAHALRALRMLGALLDASGDDAPIDFARAAESHLANKAQFWRAAIAMFGLIARARRRSEPFPDEFFALACESDFLGDGLHLASSGGFRDLVETLSPARRLAFYEKDGFSDTSSEDRKGSRAVETPTPQGAWWYADLLPNELAAPAVIEAIVGWSSGPKPKEHALDLVSRIGPACVPFLDRALAAKEKPPHRAVLVAARKLFSEP